MGFSDLDTGPTSTILNRRQIASPWNQFDSFVMLAAVVAILLGCLSAADASTSFLVESFEESQRQNVSSWSEVSATIVEYPTIALLHRLPSWLPLVFFGIGTAIAWTCTQRAVYRMALLESCQPLRLGVYLHDLSDMLELKRPGRAWFRWRVRMWRTTVFALLCIGIYASTALMYRLAFSFRTKSFTYDLDAIGSNPDLQNSITTLPLFGCQFDPSNPSLSQSDLGLPSNETRMQLNVFADIVSLPEAYAQTSMARNITTPDNSWQVLFGAHGLYHLARYIELQAPQENFQGSLAPKISSALEWDFQGPFLTAVWTHDANATLPEVAPYVGTKSHPSCGELLYVCMSFVLGDCYYLGVYPGNFVSLTSPVETDNPSNDIIPLFDSALVITGPETINMSDNCPTKLDTGLYDKLAEEYTGYWSACNGSTTNFPSYYSPGLAGDNHNWLSWCAEGPLRTVFAMLFAYLSNNPALIIDKQPMIDLGLLAANASSFEQCSQPQPWKYRGTIVAYWQVSTWPAYELAAALLLIIWGGLLAFASWPFKELVFRGTVEHWMALGEDIGVECTNEREKARRWRLKTYVDETNISKFWLEPVKEEFSI